MRIKIHFTITSIIVMILSGCASSNALISEDIIEKKNYNLENTIDQTKLEAIEEIKKQILQQKKSMNTLTNLGEKDVDPFLYLYRGLRND